ANIFQRGRVLNRLAGGHVGNDFRDRRTWREGILSGVNEETAAKERQFLIGCIIRYLTEGLVDGKRHSRYNVLIVHVGGDSYDASWPFADKDERRHRVGPHHVAVDRVLAGEHALRHTLADDHNRLAAATVVVVEVAPGKNRHAVSGKERRRNNA